MLRFEGFSESNEQGLFDPTDNPALFFSKATYVLIYNKALYVAMMNETNVFELTPHQIKVRQFHADAV